MKTKLDGLKIFVVEDEFLMSSLVQTVLDDAGCVVSVPIPRVTEAIAAARGDYCDAAVLDVNLAGGSFRWAKSCRVGIFHLLS